MNETKSNSKLKITVLVLAVALVAAIGAVFGVYAATQQNVTSSFSVNYSVGKNVAFKATTYTYDHYKYDYGDNQLTEAIEKLYSIQYNVDDTSVITAADGTVLNAIPAQNCTLSTDNRLISFVFELENLNENGIVVEVKWEDYFNFLSAGATDSIYNCKFSFMDSNMMGENRNVGRFCYEYGAGWGEDMMTPDTALPEDFTVTIAGRDKYYIIVAIGVEDPNKDALCESNETTGLTFTVTNADVYGG